MKSKTLGIFVMLFFACFLISGSTVFAEKVIKIGVTGPLQKEAGIGDKNGAELAANEINAAGGILGHKIQLFFADDGARAEIGINAAKKLIFDDKVDVIIGGWLSGVGLAQANHIFDAKKLWLSVGPATPKLANYVKQNYDRAKYFFRVGCVNSDMFAKDMVIFAKDFYKDKMGLTKLALLPESSVWAREMAKYLTPHFKDAGFEIVYTDVFDPRQTDFSAQFSKIRKSGAQVLFTIQAASPGVPLTKQWADSKLPVHQAGYSLASQVFNFWDKTGGKCNGEVTQLINGGRAPITDKTIPFYDKYVKTYGISPTYTAFGCYDALYLLKAAAEKCGSLDTDKLIKTIEKMKFPGTGGLIVFDQYHENLYGPEGKQPVWVQWQGPKKMEVIYPIKWKTAEYITPSWIK
ncbi:MAG: ABC transporter substrate-binding protein [Deltaproteobacteria bacterium]|nr:ABC transporter substrate-binding protein [Deltaproteobacteria bacterium]